MRLEALPPVEVKGKTAPVTPYKVLGTRPQRSPIVSRGERTFSQFVGQERELAVLDELLEQVEAGKDRSWGSWRTLGAANPACSTSSGNVWPASA